MIDFRYHLVSIIAVFLALAVGLVVGSTALSGKAEEALKVAQRNALANNKTLQQDKSALSNQVSADQAFAQAASQRLIGGLLAGEGRPGGGARRGQYRNGRGSRGAEAGRRHSDRAGPAPAVLHDD